MSDIETASGPSAFWTHTGTQISVSSFEHPDVGERIYVTIGTESLSLTDEDAWTLVTAIQQERRQMLDRTNEARRVTARERLTRRRGWDASSITD